LRKGELEYYEYFENDKKFYCCSLAFPGSITINYEYCPHLQELRVKKYKKNNKISEKSIFNIKPHVSRVIINVDIFIKAKKYKVKQDAVSRDGELTRDFLFKNFNYIRGIQECDKEIRDLVVKYCNDPSSVDKDPDSNDFGLVLDLINCGGIKC
jgi:hypothetical protein